MINAKPEAARQIATDPDPLAPYHISQAFRVGDLLITSGQAAISGDGELVGRSRPRQLWTAPPRLPPARTASSRAVAASGVSPASPDLLQPAPGCEPLPLLGHHPARARKNRHPRLGATGSAQRIQLRVVPVLHRKTCQGAQGLDPGEK